MNKLLDNILKEQNRFHEFLNLEGNNRIFFSGIFGLGKTLFLKDFFQKYSEEYNFYHLFPVNYQVGSNSEVFQYLKYDLLIATLEAESDSDSAIKIFKNLGMAIGKTGVQILWELAQNNVPLLKDSTKAMGRLKDIAKSAASSSVDKQIDSLIENINTSNGSIYESDAVTQYIRSKINDQSKKSVLIIDDLDRLDPEHMFRILNVFSAHYDITLEQNKFGFDHIIVVGDVKNIRNIFRARYGSNSEFNGYIDKFYTKSVFHFNNKVQIKETVRSILYEQHYLAEEADGIFFLISILTDANKFSFRHLKKLELPSIHKYIGASSKKIQNIFAFFNDCYSNDFDSVLQALIDNDSPVEEIYREGFISILAEMSQVNRKQYSCKIINAAVGEAPLTTINIDHWSDFWKELRTAYSLSFNKN